ncbi:MAG: endolytic transglycosylase MltG [Armatimonadota bacterium]|nr:endolytic transglycosylase MltG [Armatimonadota bacterium]
MRGITAVVMVGALALAGAVLVSSGLQPAAREAPQRVVVIPPGASLDQIAGVLAEAGVLRSPLAFILAARIRGVGGRLQSGEYLLSAAMSPLEILEKLVRGQVLLHRVTIPEGYTADQIADLVAMKGLAEREAFLRLVREEGDSFAFDFLEGRRNLEGYLFPDTYAFPRGLVERQIVQAMLARFDQRVSPELRREIRALGMTLHEAITVASMVEREARLEAERPIIAGVIYNRLRRGWRLEIDATVLYALGRRGGPLTAADLLVDSPYNTYRQAGLPPGPIGNPGLAAIEAAARPSSTPYLFYVLRPDGSHAFSTTLQEHLRNIRRWRR